VARQASTPRRPGLPGEGDAEEGGGDAGGEQLRRRVAHGEASGEADAGPRLELPLMRVAMDVDDAGQHQQTGRVEAARGSLAGRDPALGQRDIGRLQPPLDEGAPARQHPRHRGQVSTTSCTRPEA
jgi:hypothetical protein